MHLTHGGQANANVWTLKGSEEAGPGESGESGWLTCEYGGLT